MADPAANEFTAPTPSSDDADFKRSIEALKALTTEILTLRSTIKAQSKDIQEMSSEEISTRMEQLNKLQALVSTQSFAINKVSEQFSSLGVQSEELVNTGAKQQELAAKAAKLAAEELNTRAELATRIGAAVKQESDRRAKGKEFLKQEEVKARSLSDVIQDIKTSAEEGGEKQEPQSIASPDTLPTETPSPEGIPVQVTNLNPTPEQVPETPAPAVTELAALIDELAEAEKKHIEKFGNIGSIQEKVNLFTNSIKEMHKKTMDYADNVTKARNALKTIPAGTEEFKAAMGAYNNALMEYQLKTSDIGKAYIATVQAMTFAGTKVKQGYDLVAGSIKKANSQYDKAIEAYDKLIDGISGFVRKWFSLSGLLRLVGVATIFGFNLLAGGVKKLYQSSIFGRKSFEERQKKEKAAGTSVAPKTPASYLPPELVSTLDLADLVPRKQSFTSKVAKQAAEMGKGLANAGKSVAGFAKSLAAGASKMTTAIIQFVTPVLAAAASFVAGIIMSIATFVGSVIAAVVGFVSPFIAAAAPVLIVVAIVLLLIGALYLLYQKFEGFRNVVDDYIINPLMEVAGLVYQRFDEFTSAINDYMVNPLMEVAGLVYQRFDEFTSAIDDYMVSPLKKAADWISSWFGGSAAETEEYQSSVDEKADAIYERRKDKRVSKMLLEEREKHFQSFEFAEMKRKAREAGDMEALSTMEADARANSLLLRDARRGEALEVDRRIREAELQPSLQTIPPSPQQAPRVVVNNVTTAAPVVGGGGGGGGQAYVPMPVPVRSQNTTQNALQGASIPVG